jgi:photosystem II protein
MPSALLRVRTRSTLPPSPPPPRSVAQLGFAFSLIGEAATGKGPLAQFDIETGLSLRDTEAGLVAFILFLLFAAINEGSGRFVDDDA